MPDGAGTHEATGEGVTELVIALPHGGSVTVQFNPYLVIEHPIIRCVLCVKATPNGVKNRAAKTKLLRSYETLRTFWAQFL